MSNIREIPLEPANAGVIEILEQALAEAREGKISTVVVTAIERDGMPVFSRSEMHNRSLMIGAVSRHLHRLLQAADDVD